MRCAFPESPPRKFLARRTEEIMLCSRTQTGNCVIRSQPKRHVNSSIQKEDQELRKQVLAHDGSRHQTSGSRPPSKYITKNRRFLTDRSGLFGGNGSGIYRIDKFL